MSPSASDSSSPRRFSASSTTRRASTGPRVLSSSVSSTSFPHAQVGHPFGSATAIQVNRTVSVTIEVLSSSALASHMDVSQYHIPVTTSCYSPTTYEYPSIASEYGTSISYSSQGAYPFTPSATSGSSSSYYGQSSVNGTQGSPSFLSGSSEYHLLSRPLYQQQQGIDSGHAFSNIGPSQLTMLDRFLTVDSREDALVVEARAAIQEGRARDENILSPGLYGWESVIDSL